jgi:HlyD family secretion protein
VVRVAVREGDPVREGDLLLELDCTEPQARLAEAEARVAAAEDQANAARAQVEAAGRQQRAASAAARATAAQVAIVEANREAAAREQARVHSLGEFVPPMQRDQAGDAVRALLSQESAARAQASASRAQAAVVGAQVDAAASNEAAAQHALEAMRAIRTLAQLAVDECAVRARRDGIVETVYFDAGELVSAGAPLVRVVDLREVTATFYLPNAEVGAVTPGARAEVVADAWPDVRFRGVVSTISLEAAFTPRTVQTRSDRDRLVYPVEVRIDNHDGRLRPGMPVQVTVSSP